MVSDSPVPKVKPVSMIFCVQRFLATGSFVNVQLTVAPLAFAPVVLNRARKVERLRTTISLYRGKHVSLSKDSAFLERVPKLNNYERLNRGRSSEKHGFLSLNYF